MKSKGFTILEVLIVVVILLTLAGIAAFSYRGATQTYTLTSAYNQLMLKLKSARAEAIANNNSVEFVQVGNVYVIRRVSDLSVIYNNIVLGSGVTLQYNNFAGDHVVFDFRGTVSNTAATTPTIDVKKGTQTPKTISLEAGTGYIH